MTFPHSVGPRSVAIALPALFALAAPVRADTVVFNETFPNGSLANWTRCAQPFEDNLAQCSFHVGGGSGAHLYANPAIMPGITDPVSMARGGGIVIHARPLTEADKAHLAKALDAQTIRPDAATALKSATWGSGWLESRQAFPVGTSITARFLPGAGPSAWSGIWAYSDINHRQEHAEIDIAEVTNRPDGSMLVRQVIHWPAAITGKLQRAGCTSKVTAHSWITATAIRKADGITFYLNGIKTCSVPNEPGLDHPMQLIISQQVGGLVKAPTPATRPFAMAVQWVRVSRVD